MGYSGGSSEDQNAKRNVDSRGLVPEVFGGNQGLSVCQSGTELEASHPGKDPTASCLCSEQSSESKSDGLICLAEDILRQGSNQACGMASAHCSHSGPK